MTISRTVMSFAALAMMAGTAFAQAPAPSTTPAKPAAPMAAPASQPAQAAPAAKAVQAKINLNTATVAELETLHGVGEVRAKKIVEERSKSKFKDYDDLMKRKVLPSNVEVGIKDRVTF